MTSFDPDALPRVAAYERSLPDGLGSYPQCRVRTVVVRASVDRFPGVLGRAGVDPGFSEQVGSHVARDEWMPETLAVALALLCRDAEFSGDDAFLNWHYELSSEIFKQRLYRALMYVVSPTLVVLGAQKRWGAFRQGSTLSAKVTRNEGEASLEFPSHLYPELTLRGFGEAFQAALVAARARGPSVELIDVTPRSARWTMRWT